MITTSVYYAILIITLLVAVGLPFIPHTVRPKWAFRRISIKLFDDYTQSNKTLRESKQQRLLQQAHMGQTKIEYQSETLLYSVLYAIIGAIIGLYATSFLISIFAITPEELATTLPEQLSFLIILAEVEGLTILDIFLLFLFGIFTFGMFSGYGVYLLRWWLPQKIADHRAEEIDDELPQLVAFTYALSRSGASFTEIMRTVAQSQQSYGEAAKEFNIGVTQIDVYGKDIVTALREMSARTPSDDFSEFSSNLASVLESGQNIPEFLSNQYERYQQQEEQQQRAFIDIIATLAEAYVAAFVVGPLLLYTVLVIVGLFGIGETLFILQLLIYLIIPLATISFLLYLKDYTNTYEQIPDVNTDVTRPSDNYTSLRPNTTEETPLENESQNSDKLDTYEHVRQFKQTLQTPLQTLQTNPASILYVTVPIITLITIIRLGILYTNNNIALTTVDHILIQGAIAIIVSLALAYQYYSNYIEGIRNAVPDFLDRFASVNEAGMSLINGFRRVANSDLNEFNTEINRIQQDIDHGVEISNAFQRMESRVRIPLVTQTVTLIKNAMNATGQIGPVLRIAARQAQETRRLQQKRRDELKTYLVIIYLAFFVFLIIIAALTEVLIPSIPLDTIGELDSGTLGFEFQPQEIEIFSVILFHAALIQSTISGFIAGVMGEGDIKAGAKHASVLMIITYIIYILLI